MHCVAIKTLYENHRADLCLLFMDSAELGIYHLMDEKLMVLKNFVWHYRTQGQLSPSFFLPRTPKEDKSEE